MRIRERLDAVYMIRPTDGTGNAPRLEWRLHNVNSAVMAKYVGDSREFRVSLTAGHAVEVQGATAGLDVDAMLGVMISERDRDRRVHLEFRERGEIYAIQLMVLSERAKKLPPAEAARIQSLSDAWGARERLWEPEAEHGECSQDRCQPASLLTDYRYQDPVTQEERRALGYVHVCLITGRAHTCTSDRCDAVSSNTTSSSMYVCRVTGAVYGQMLITEGFRSNQEAARDTRTLPRADGGSQGRQERARRHRRHVGGGVGARIAANRTLPLDDRIQLLADQARQRQRQAQRMVDTLLFGAPARASRENARRRTADTLERADRAVVEYLTKCTATPCTVHCCAVWLNATSACTPVSRVPHQQHDVDRRATVCRGYAAVGGALWRLLLLSEYARGAPEVMHWGNHVLATLYLLRTGCTPEAGGPGVPRDQWLEHHLPITGAVDLREHLGLGKRAFSKGAEVIQNCLATLPPGRADVRAATLELRRLTVEVVDAVAGRSQ